MVRKLFPWRPSARLLTGVGLPISIAAADLNGDGIEDLIIGVNGGSVQVLLGTVTGHTAQTITFGVLNNVSYGIAPFTLSATATSGLAVTFASTTPVVCTVTGSTVTIVSAGACTIVASQPGNATFAPAATVSRTLTVNPPPQTITFGSLSDQNVGTAFALAATSTSGLAVSFTSNSPHRSVPVSGNTVTTLSQGTCSITATQPGNASFAAATPVTQSFSVVIYTGPTTCIATTANALFVRAEGAAEQVADSTITCQGGGNATMNLQVYLSPAVAISSATVGTGGNAVSEAVAGVTASGITFSGNVVHGIVSGSSVTFGGIQTGPGTFTVKITNLRIIANQVATSSGAPTAIGVETIFVGGTNITPDCPWRGNQSPM